MPSRVIPLSIAYFLTDMRNIVDQGRFPKPSLPSA